MGAEGGMEDTGVTNAAVAEQLTLDPPAYEFFQAVRLLERLYPERRAVGRFGDPTREVAHFSARTVIAFPASEIHAVDLPGDRPARMVVNFMGLIGPLGLLPYHYTQLVAERSRVHDRALRDFFDIFQHRLISLFYRAWEKYHFTAAYERDGRRLLIFFTRRTYDAQLAGTPGTVVKAGKTVVLSAPAATGKDVTTTLDTAALRAVLATRTLPPLPDAFPNSTLTMRLSFQYQ